MSMARDTSEDVKEEVFIDLSSMEISESALLLGTSWKLWN